MNLPRIGSVRLALIAFAAMCFAAPSAKAELDLTIENNDNGKTYNLGPVTLANNYSLTSTSGAGAGGAGFSNASSVFINGSSLQFTVTQVQTGNSNALVITGGLTAGTSASDNFTFKLTSTSTTSTPGAFTSLGNGTNFLASISTLNSGPTGSQVTTTSDYIGYTSGSVATDEFPGGVSAQQSGGNGTTTTVASFNNTGNATYDLSSIAADVSGLANSTISFQTTTMVFVPEPAGVVASAAGLPCVLTVLGLVRRRRSASVPTVA